MTKKISLNSILSGRGGEKYSSVIDNDKNQNQHEDRTNERTKTNDSNIFSVAEKEIDAKKEVENKKIDTSGEKTQDIMETELKNNGKTTNNSPYEDTILELPIDFIQLNPKQPRKTFSPESLEELAESISQHGVIQPLVVSKIKSGYVLVAGERRLRASKIAGLTTVPVVIRNSSEAVNREIALIENIQRENLNAIEEARAMKEMMEQNHLSYEELAKKLGKSRPTISNALRLLSLPVIVQQYIEEGKLTAGHAKALLTAKNPSRIIALAKECIQKGWSVRELEKKSRIDNPTLKKKGGMLTDEMADFERDMQQVFATDVTLSGDLTKGKILIKYTSNGELQRIFEIIQGLKDNQN